MCVYAKLIGNVPTAKWVEDYGRKPVMIGGMAVCAVGLGSIGFALDPALGTPWLIGCRFVTGFGVAAFTSGAFMYAFCSSFVLPSFFPFFLFLS